MTDEPMVHIHHLAVEIGPRGSATPQEEEAAAYVAGQLAALGLKVEREEFPSLTTFSWPYLILYLFPALALGLSFFNPWLSVLIGLTGAAAFFLELNCREVIEPFLPKATGHNVLGHLPPREEPHRRVVILAHHDSSKAALNFSPGMVKNFRTSFLLMVGSVVATPVLLLLYVLTGMPVWRWVALLPVLYLVAAVFFLLHREWWNRYTHGANDNASGVGTMLALAARAAKERLQHTELFFLSTGCEEAGTFGIRHFLRTRGDQFREAYFVNLDNIGAGTVHFMEREGMFPSFPADRELVAHCRALAQKLPELKVREGRYTLMPTDATRLLINDYKAISFLAVNGEGLLPNWHWVTDTYENVEPETVATCRDFVWELLLRLDGISEQ